MDMIEKEYKLYKCKLTISEPTVYFLEEDIDFKIEINWVKKMEKRLNCESSFYVYPNYLVLDNIYFTLKIYYNKIIDVEFIDNMSVLFGNAITLLFESNNRVYLNISNIDSDEWDDLKSELIEKVKNPPFIGQNEILKVINCIIVEKLENLYKSDNITSLKKDISCLNKTVFEENGVFIIYDNHLKIENAIFIQEFPYSLIKNIELTDESIMFILDNDESITLKFNVDDELTDELKNKIQENVVNPPYYNTNITSNQVTNNSIVQVPSTNEANNLTTGPVVNKKSNVICFILNLFFCGAGYAYVDKWGRFLVSFFIIWPILIFIGFVTLMIPPILYWIFVVINSNSMVNKYNEGIQY